MTSKVKKKHLLIPVNNLLNCTTHQRRSSNSLNFCSGGNLSVTLWCICTRGTCNNCNIHWVKDDYTFIILLDLSRTWRNNNNNTLISKTWQWIEYVLWLYFYHFTWFIPNLAKQQLYFNIPNFAMNWVCPIFCSFTTSTNMISLVMPVCTP